MNPFFIARNGLYFNIKLLSKYVQGNVLDVGCGQKPYESLFTNATKYIGLELNTPENRKNKKADFFYDGINFPFEKESFDSIIVNQVLEHVFNPEVFLDNINNVLKVNGTLLLTVPFVWDEHEQPYDYARYSSFGLAHLLENNGFEIIEHCKSVKTIAVVFQLINCYIHKLVNSFHISVKIVFWIFLCMPFSIIGTILGAILPDNSDLYLDNIVCAKKMI